MLKNHDRAEKAETGQKSRESSGGFGRRPYQPWVKWDMMAFKLGLLRRVLVPKLKSVGNYLHTRKHLSSPVCS